MRRSILRIARAQPFEVIHGNVMLARGGTEREQPLFGLVKLIRFAAACPQGRIEMGARLVQRPQSRVERFHGRLDQHRRLRAATLKPSHSI